MHRLFGGICSTDLYKHAEKWPEFFPIFSDYLQAIKDSSGAGKGR
jgi:hypothetical protein